MPTTQAKRYGGVALAVALLVTVMSAGIAPSAAAASGDCSEESTLQFDTLESDSLDRLANDAEDIWKVDVPSRSGDVQLDVDWTSGDDLEVELFEKNSGNCDQVGSEQDVVSGPEFENLDDDQKYWVHVALAETTDTEADYDIIMEDD